MVLSIGRRTNKKRTKVPEISVPATTTKATGASRAVVPSHTGSAVPTKKLSTLLQSVSSSSPPAFPPGFALGQFGKRRRAARLDRGVLQIERALTRAAVSGGPLLSDGPPVSAGFTSPPEVPLETVPTPSPTMTRRSRKKTPVFVGPSATCPVKHVGWVSNWPGTSAEAAIRATTIVCGFAPLRPLPLFPV